MKAKKNETTRKIGRKKVDGEEATEDKTNYLIKYLKLNLKKSMDYNLCKIITRFKLTKRKKDKK